MPKIHLQDYEMLDYLSRADKVTKEQFITYLVKNGYSESGARGIIRRWINNYIIQQFKTPGLKTIYLRKLLK